MRSSIASSNEQLNPRNSQQTYHAVHYTAIICTIGIYYE